MRAALNVYSDWAVAPGVTLAIFKNGSKLALFDSFKPSCGYSTYWIAIADEFEGAKVWMHIDMRDVVNGRDQEMNIPPISPRLKMARMSRLLCDHFEDAAAFLLAARRKGLVISCKTGEPL